ncbi:MAG: HlyD family secretion protein [Candidatus Eremiobacteraeota bacterium]|nr:HlyD family secretion protein [Candidatus Eremiobacteraeota bacterium]
MESVETAKPTTGTIPTNGNGKPAAPAQEAVVDKPKREANPNVRRAMIAVGAIAVILLLIWGVKYFLYARSHQTTDDARIDASAVSVTSKIAERVNQIFVDTDQPVHKGQVLIQLDSRDERSRLAQAQAAVNAQRAQAAAAQSNVTLTQQTVAAQATESLGGITSAQSGISGAQANVDVARAGITTAQAGVPAAQEALNRANADLHRTESLVSTGDIPKSQLDAARANAAGAQAQYQQAVANVSAAQDRLSAASTSIGSAQGQLNAAQGKLQESTSPARVAASQAQANAAFATVGSLLAQLQLAKDQVSETRIVAPVDGFVGEKNAELGQTVAPGTPLMTIIPSKDIHVTANFKETQLGSIRPGQPVDITVDAYKGTTFHGHVVAINPASQSTYSLVPAQNASGNFIKVTQRIPVKIAFDNPPADKPLRPGMSVVASVKVK